MKRIKKFSNTPTLTIFKNTKVKPLSNFYIAGSFMYQKFQYFEKTSL